MVEVSERHEVATPQAILRKYLTPQAGLPEDNISSAVRRGRDDFLGGLNSLDLDDLCVLRELVVREAKKAGGGRTDSLDDQGLGFAHLNVDAAIREKSQGSIKSDTIIGNLTIMARAFARSAGFTSTQLQSAEVECGLKKAQGSEKAL